jgi:hypothetical protein
MEPMPPLYRSLLLSTLLLLGMPQASSAITGVCPDGSIFIVQQARDIPCPAAKRVDPNDVPPLNPEFLPRPYGWELFNRETDPNNPYNLVDSARLRGGEGPVSPAGAPPTSGGQPVAPGQAAQPAAPPVPEVAMAPAPGQATPATDPRGKIVDVGLSPGDLADLGTIVDLMQQKAPATLVRPDESGGRRAVLRVARSFAFERHLLPVLDAQGTPGDGLVVLVRAVADDRVAFFGNLTFVQGHVAFHPDTASPGQFGVLDGALGRLDAGDSVLAYTVLPQHMDLTEPIDIYWDDRRITATLLP